MSIMTVNGLGAEINTPKALEGEGLHGLPPHRQKAAHVVDEYPACPDNWEHGSDKASSYFISLEAGRGMWFDFTQNHHHANHVAVVISVQGVNPVTGKPITELSLVQYKKQCPVHKVDFQQDRYCPTCKYKWPAQNYIATTTGESRLWLDGFRNENGEVRQYIISEEQAQGIARQIEDKDPEFKRVWAIGFAFYLSKDPKPAPPPSPPHEVHIGFATMDMSAAPMESEVLTSANYLERGENSQSSARCYSAKMPSSSALRRSTREAPTAPIEKVVDPKKLEVGAGARIGQDVGVDPNPIEFWKESPAGMIYVNFTGKETLQKILDAGKRKDKAEGPLNDMKVGN